MSDRQDSLRDKIARAMIAETILKALVFTNENSKAWADGLARDIAAVLDLDKVRAEAWGEGHVAGWNSRDDDAARGWMPSGVHESDAENPYRKADQ